MCSGSASSGRPASSWRSGCLKTTQREILSLVQSPTNMLLLLCVGVVYSLVVAAVGWMAASRSLAGTHWLQAQSSGVEEPIDVVYTWVNGSDPAFLRELMTWRQHELAAGSIKEEDVPVPEALTGGSRYRDNEELCYSLRSIQDYAPWVRNIYIVTNGQVPFWLDLSHPRMQIVTHDQIFTNRSHLPTFSSPAIEVHLHRIPGLSKKFIYFNDDVFLMQPVWPDDFYTRGGGQKLYFAWEVPPCASDCNAKWLGDGYCDKPCNVSACNFDFGDCVNVTSTHGGSGGWGGSSSYTGSSYCSSGCMFSWIGDRYCDPRCLNEECGYDGGDCGLEKQVGKLLTYDGVRWGNQTHHVPLNTSSALFNISSVFPAIDISQATFSDRKVVRSASINNKSKALTVVFGTKDVYGARNVTIRISGYGPRVPDGITTPLPVNNTTEGSKGDTYDAHVLVNGMAISKYPGYRSPKPAEHNPNHTLVSFDLVLFKTFPPAPVVNSTGRDGSSSPATQYSHNPGSHTYYDEFDHDMHWGGGYADKWGEYDDLPADLARRKLLTPPSPPSPQAPALPSPRPQALPSPVLQLPGQHHQRHPAELAQKQGQHGYAERRRWELDDDPAERAEQAQQAQQQRRLASLAPLQSALQAVASLGDAALRLLSGASPSAPQHTGHDDAAQQLAQADPGTGTSGTADMPHALELVMGQSQRASMPSSSLSHSAAQQRQLLLQESMEGLVSGGQPRRRLLDLFGDSLRFVDGLLTDRYGPDVRKVPSHMPDMMDRSVLDELQAVFPAQYAATSAHRFRSPNDMQYAFSYFSFLKNEQTDRTPADVLQEADRDGDRRLSNQELLTLVLQTVPPNNTRSHKQYGNGYHSSYHDSLDSNAILSRSEAEAWRQRLKDQVAASDWFPGRQGVALSVLLDHKELTEHIWKRLQKETKYQTQVGDAKLSGFLMLHSDLPALRRQLDSVRARPPRFLCLNDNFNDSLADAAAPQEVQDFLQAAFPKPSPYELPFGRHGVTHIHDWWRVQRYRRIYAALRAACLVLLVGGVLHGMLSRRRQWRRRAWPARATPTNGRSRHSKLLDV